MKEKLMTIEIRYTVKVSNEFRRALSYHAGYRGKSTRNQVKHWYAIYGSSRNKELIDKYDRRP